VTELEQFILKKVKNEWELNKRPYLLSSLGSDLKEANFFEQLNGQSLKLWIDSNKASLKLKLVASKQQKEKVGVIENCNDYNYDEELNITFKNNKNILSEFIKLLECLSEEDRKLINIPFYIWVKLNNL